MQSDYKAPDSKWFEENELTPPVVSVHGTDEDVRSNLKPVKMWNWKLSGNELSCDTDHGKLVQTIPTNYICKGTDADGKPILHKIG